MRIEEVVGHFKGDIQTGDSTYKVLCPCHQDQKPSLAIALGENGKVVLHCHAGCLIEDILEKAGLSMQDLFDSGKSIRRSRKSQLSPEVVALRHEVYSTVLAACRSFGFDTPHIVDLATRGLTPYPNLGYASLSIVGIGTALTKLRQTLGVEKILTVPGFVKDSMGFVRPVRSEGLAIPIRQPDGSIVALQVRGDDADGKYKWFSSSEESCGAVVHVPVGVPITTGGLLRITEGPLKADTCSIHQPDVITLGVPGVTTWRTALPLLELYKPSRIRLAFDADWQDKPQVRRELHRAYQALTEEGYQVDVEVWPLEVAKGIDDLLQLGHLPTLAGEAEVRPTLEEEFPEHEEIIVVNAATLVEKPIEWLWEGWLSYGSLNTLDGDPGDGKSTLVASICSACTSGISLFGSSRLHNHPVLLMACEDSREKTWLPRLRAAGADVSLIEFWDGVRDSSSQRWLPSLPGDIRKLEYLIRSREAGLVIIDPLYSFLDTQFDSCRDQDMKHVLSALSDLADRTNACIIGVRHLNKATGLSSMYRGMGSMAVIGVARSGLMVVRDTEDEDLRYLTHIKSNLGKLQKPLRFRLVEVGSTVRIEWEGQEQGNLRDLTTTDKAPVSTTAVLLLTNLLQKEDIPAAEVYKMADRAGVSDKTLKRAKKMIGVKSHQLGGIWYWSLTNGKSQ